MDYGRKMEKQIWERIVLKSKSWASDWGYILLFNIGAYIIAYGGFVYQMHFSTDDYSSIYYQKETAVTVASESYRNILGLLYWLMDLLRINVVLHQVFFGSILLLIFAWSTTIVTVQIYTLCKKSANIMLVNLGSLFLFLNAFGSEWMWYAQAYIQWAIAVVTSVFAAVFIAGSEKNTLRWIKGVILLFFTASTYQICISHFVCIVMTLIFFRYRGQFNTKVFLLLVRAAAACIFSVLGNILLTKILISTNVLYEKSRMRLGNIGSLMEYIGKMQGEIWINGYGLFPHWTMLFVLAVIFVCAGWNMRRHGCLPFLFLLFTVFMGQCVVYAAFLLQGIPRIPMRMTMPLFSVYSVSLYYVAFSDLDQKNRAAGNKIAFATSMLFLVFNLFVLQEQAADTVRTNTLDQFYIKQIVERIREYEVDQKVEVSEVGICFDAAIEYKYKEYIEHEYFGEILTKAFINEWSDVNALNYYSGRYFTKTEVPREIKDQIKQQDWEHINLDEQLIFCGSKVYIAVY